MISSFQVMLAENTRNICPYIPLLHTITCLLRHKNVSSLSICMVLLWVSISAPTLFNISTRCLFLLWVQSTNSTVDNFCIPRSIKPLSPVISISLPNEDKWSYQKRVDFPLLTSILTKDFRHIHEPNEDDWLSVQKEPLRIRCIRIQFTQSEDYAENILQINLRHKTLFKPLMTSTPDLLPSWVYKLLSMKPLPSFHLVLDQTKEKPNKAYQYL